MSRIHADFRRRRGPSRAWWWGAGLLCLVAVASLVLAWEESRRVKEKTAELADVRWRHASSQPQAAPVRPMPAYDASARALLHEQAFPWAAALTTIEATAIVGVTPSAIEFSATERSLRLEVQFSDYAKLLEYIEALNAGEPELKWSLAQSQSQGTGGSTALLVGNAGR